ncbi:MAG: hypothetical protein IKY83_13510 [Proteobacteria bacterium]|nr:hypothetical protein [Pseudomonadota bacterium]
MIFTPSHLSRASLNQIRVFEKIHPTPQVPAWEASILQFIKKGMRLEALILSDDIVARYGRDIGRKLTDRVFGLPVSARGRGVTRDCSQADHPSKYALCQECLPIQIGHYACLRNGRNCLLVSEDNGENHMLNVLSDLPMSEPVFDGTPQNEPIQWLGIGSHLLVSRGTDTLTIIDLSNPDYPRNEAKPHPLPYATLRFESPIKRLCGPLSDGTFFVTLAPPMPVFSDICRLCRLDLAAIDEAISVQNGCDARAVNGVLRDIVLPNIEQTLLGDCCPEGDVFVTCGGGMQNREVRFIDAEGAWTTRFVHESPVVRIIQTEAGVMSLDETGTALLWHDQKPVADTRFDLTDLPEFFDLSSPETRITADWTHQRLYLTTSTPQPNLKAVLAASHSLYISPDIKRADAFVKAIYHLPDHTLAMLSDGSIHFWDIGFDCVSPLWQLPQTCADSNDWRALLNINCPAIEEDPRIRIVRI